MAFVRITRAVGLLISPVLTSALAEDDLPGLRLLQADCGANNTTSNNTTEIKPCVADNAQQDNGPQENTAPSNKTPNGTNDTTTTTPGPILTSTGSDNTTNDTTTTTTTPTTGPSNNGTTTTTTTPTAVPTNGTTTTTTTTTTTAASTNATAATASVDLQVPGSIPKAGLPDLNGTQQCVFFGAMDASVTQTLLATSMGAEVSGTKFVSPHCVGARRRVLAAAAADEAYDYLLAFTLKKATPLSATKLLAETMASLKSANGAGHLATAIVATLKAASTSTAFKNAMAQAGVSTADLTKMQGLLAQVTVDIVKSSLKTADIKGRGTDAGGVFMDQAAVEAAVAKEDGAGGAAASTSSATAYAVAVTYAGMALFPVFL